MENRTNAIEDIRSGDRALFQMKVKCRDPSTGSGQVMGTRMFVGRGGDSRFPFDSPDAAVSLRAGSSLWPGGAASGNGRIVYIFFCGSWLSHDSLDPSRRSA